MTTVGRVLGVTTLVAVLLGVLAGAGGPIGATEAGADGSAAVTTSTIRVGVPYVTFVALKSLGVDRTEGSFPDAFRALIANINAHGGIDDRKIVPYVVGVNPAASSDAQTACTELAEDDDVFIALGPEQSDCYLETQHIPTIEGLFEGTAPASAAANFTITPPAKAYDPLELSVFDKVGDFKGKKVGLFALATTAAELKVDQASLAKLHVDVVQTATDSAPATDQTAEYQQADVIAQRFVSAGVSEVVAVGGASSLWPKALAADQSTYDPSWIATSASDLTGSTPTTSAKAESKYLKTMVSSDPLPSYYQAWETPGIQKCVAIVKKAYPSDDIAPPPPSGSPSAEPWVAVEQACRDLAIFTSIAQAAGKHLTVASFTKAGEGLHGVSFPASGGKVSFGRGQPYALGPVHLLTYDAATNSFVEQKKSAATS